MDPMISLRGLTKRFGRRVAVDALDLEVPRGAIFGLLGHNGAGKSTTLGCLLGHLFPDEGRLTVDGVDVLRHRGRALARTGAIFEAPAFYDYLSGAWNLRMLAESTGCINPAQWNSVVNLVGLAGRMDDRVATYSHGMRQRLALAQALIHDPDLLILDEPTDGLDPEGIHEMRELVLRLNRERGLTILLSSHLLAEVEQVCTHIAVMRDARLVWTGAMNDLPRPEGVVVLKARDWDAAVARLRSANLLAEALPPDQVRLNPGATLDAAAAAIAGSGCGLEALHPVAASLETFYLSTAAGAGRREAA